MKVLFLSLFVVVTLSCSTKPKEGASNNPGTSDNPAATSAIAAQAGAITPAPEWKGRCRKMVSEAGQVTPGQEENRLQSSYTFADKAVVLYVRSFRDSKCEQMMEANRYFYECDSNPRQQLAKCKSVRRETAAADKVWKQVPLVDYNGDSSASETQYSVRFLKTKKAVLKAIDESGEESSETLIQN